MKLEFPKNFFWGAATSAHQVEGGNHNDWTEWEKETNHPISGRACNHYVRFHEDFDIAKSLNQNAHRFSIEWSRIEPEEGKWDEKEIEHYRDVIRALRERGIEPFVTLWHWTLPIWVAKQGGWENKKTIDDFTRYVDKIIRSLKSVAYWITLNEPEIYTFNSYLRGKWPPTSPAGGPQKKSFFKFLKVYRNLIDAHKQVFDSIHTWVSDTQVGIAKNNSYFEGWLAPILNYFWNNWFLNKIKNHQNFIGLNYYFHNRIKGFKLNQNDNKEVSDFDWEIYPEGIYHVLKDLQKYRKPIYITENGVADAKDIHREKFIKEHLRWTHKAIAEGVDVRGYFYWSLLDNFEWDKGFWPRFGLVEMDYSAKGGSASGGKTLERKIRPSALEYAKIAKENGLSTPP